MMTRKTLLIFVAAILMYALVGFFLTPPLVRWYVPNYAQQKLHCLARLDNVRINPFLLTIEINGFGLNQTDGLPLVAIDRLFANLEMSSLFRWAVVLRELELDNPDIHVVFEPDSATNFHKLALTPTPAPEPAQSKANPLPIIVRKGVVRGGRIALLDRHQGTPADLRLSKLSLHLKDLSTLKNHSGTYYFSAATEDGESVQCEGEVLLIPFRSKGKLNFNAVRTASLWKFFKDNTNLEQPTGLITINTQYHLDAGKTPIQMTLDQLRGSLSDLSLKLLHTDKTFLKLEKLEVDAPLIDLVGRQLNLGKLLAENGAVDVRVNESGGMNLQRILRASLPDKHHDNETPSPNAPSTESVPEADQRTTSPPAPAEPAAADPPFKMNADTIAVKDVSLALHDESRKIPIKAEIAAINLIFKAGVEVGSNENKVNLKEISSTLKAINIQGSQSPESLFAAETLTLEGGDYDLGARSITASRIALSKGRLDVGRDAGGKINWLQLFQAKGAAEGAPESVPASATVPAWKFLAKSFEIDGFNARISDLTTHSDKPVLSMQDLQAKLVDVDGKSPMGFTLDFQMERGGSAKLSGIVNPSIPSVEAAINVSGVDLMSLQPYIEPYVTLVMESASVSAQGNLSYGVPGAAQKTAYEGDFRLDHLRLADAGSQKPYLSWDAMQIPRLKFMLQPNGLDIQEIKITKPVGELIIGEDKTLNLKKVLRNQKSSNKTPVPSVAGDINNQETFPYHISRVQVEKGNMIFADLSLRPRFMTRIHDIKGEITALSSAQNAQAKISLDGYVDEYGTAKIRGVIRPEDFGRSSDVEMVFRNLEMKNLSPYSGKFAGRLIKSGKFSADLKYQIQDYKMTGDNKIVLQNLALGEYVAEQGAANLPLDLAIALLKDSNGRIDIGLPITGDLNDPQFSIGPVIWQLFTNMITKVATAPFSALGNMFGGETENFDAVEFAPGSAELPPPEKEKLLKLADVLKNRPQLKLIIQGRYSPEADGKEFKDLSIRRIVASRLDAQTQPGRRPEVA